MIWIFIIVVLRNKVMLEIIIVQKKKGTMYVKMGMMNEIM